MKRTCLQKNTNTEEQIACEFPRHGGASYPVEYFVKTDKLEPTVNQ